LNLGAQSIKKCVWQLNNKRIEGYTFSHHFASCLYIIWNIIPSVRLYLTKKRVNTSLFYMISSIKQRCIHSLALFLPSSRMEHRMFSKQMITKWKRSLHYHLFNTKIQKLAFRYGKNSNFPPLVNSMFFFNFLICILVHKSISFSSLTRFFFIHVF